MVTSAVSLLGLHNIFKLSPFLWPKNDSVLLHIVLPRALGIYYICNQENKSLRLAEIYLVAFNSSLFASHLVHQNEEFIPELSFNEQISRFLYHSKTVGCHFRALFLQMEVVISWVGISLLWWFLLVLMVLEFKYPS